MPSLSDHLKGDDLDINLAAIRNTAPNLLKSTNEQLITEACAAYTTVTQSVKEMLTQARRLAFRKEPVLILGETGTGKELVANILHATRARESKLVSINCSGLTESLFESLVFGHRKGSFTGSLADEPGLLRSAGNGTAFFDEVGELPPSQQAKLLRALQTNMVRPVGDTTEYDIHCRFVFATHRELSDLSQSGQFRSDLYYRISKFVLRTLPLRDRPADLIPICKTIYARNDWVWIPSMAEPGAEPPLEAYAKGNVRQLENYLARREVLNLTVEEALVDL